MFKETQSFPGEAFFTVMLSAYRAAGTALWLIITLLGPRGLSGHPSNRCSVQLHLWSKCFIGQAGQLRHPFFQFRIIRSDGGRSHSPRLSDPPSVLFFKPWPITDWRQVLREGPRPTEFISAGLHARRTPALAFIPSGIIPDLSLGANLINIHSNGRRKGILNLSDMGVNIWAGVYLIASLGASWCRREKCGRCRDSVG